MFWKKSGTEEKKLPAPVAIPQIVQKYLIDNVKMDPDIARILKAVVFRNSNEQNMAHIRIFDDGDALARKTRVQNYTSLNEHQELVLYEGLFDETAKKVELEEKKKVDFNARIFTLAEIQQKIESLAQPGSSVFFYAARGSSFGGPLGMGAAIIELNPGYPGKGQKKYNINTADVVDGQPVDKGQRFFSSNKAREIASWVVSIHHKRVY